MDKPNCQDLTEDGLPCTEKAIFECKFCRKHMLSPNKSSTIHNVNEISLSANYLLTLPLDLIEPLLSYLSVDQSLTLSDTVKQWSSIQNKKAYWISLYQRTLSKKLLEFNDVRDLQRMYRIHKERLDTISNKMPHILYCEWEVACANYLNSLLHDPKINVEGIKHAIDHVFFNVFQSGDINQLKMLMPYVSFQMQLSCKLTTCWVMNGKVKAELDELFDDIKIREATIMSEPVDGIEISESPVPLDFPAWYSQVH